MNKKISVLVLCGGQSTEHEISLLSAKNVVAALDLKKYSVAVVYITHAGAWHYIDDVPAYLAKGPERLRQENRTCPVLCHLGANTASLVAFSDTQKVYPLDCVIPMLHGTNGEDGSIQGLLQLMNVAYVGADVLSSSLCMDKAITKQILSSHGIPTTPWILLKANEDVEGVYENVRKQFGAECFVKPASLGSSVGISLVKNEAEFLDAVRKVMRYDRHLLVEQRIQGREIECAVLGNQNPVAALPCEIISHHDFYSYEAKYLDPKGATTVVPAKIPASAMERVRQMAVDVFRAMRCDGLLRVDFFMVDETTFLVNEVNTIPGFTHISMYPKMWEASGISYAELIDELIDLAVERHRSRSELERLYVHLAHQTQDNRDQRVS